MAERFDMTGALRFDLARGRVSAGGVGARVVLPVDALSLLCRSLGHDQLSDFGHGLGNTVGKNVAQRVGSRLSTLETADMVEQLGGELALMGLGSLSMEYWGRALVVSVVDSPLVFGDGNRPDNGDILLASVIAGALLRITSRELEVVPLARLDDTVRFVICSPAARSHIESWLGEGCHYGEALARLNEAGARA